MNIEYTVVAKKTPQNIRFSRYKKALFEGVKDFWVKNYESFDLTNFQIVP